MPLIPTVAAGRASSVPIRSWQVQCSSIAADSGEAVSRSDYRAEQWLDAPSRSTVMAALLTAGRYSNVFFSTALRDDIDAGQFRVPWWYRTLFTVAGGGRTTLRVDGVIHGAALWVNGTRVAGADEIAGAYSSQAFDVTDLIEPGVNALAFEVSPGHPDTDLSVGWIDWNPMPPDTNMGIWRDVQIVRTGDVRLCDPHVISELSETHDQADLRLTVDVENASSREQIVTIAGVVALEGVAAGTDRGFSREVIVPAGARKRVAFTAADTAELAIAHPEVWWPVGQGDQPLYELGLTASTAGLASDQSLTTFGVRRVESHLENGGGRQFVINGRPVQLLGAGWCPDIFLRWDQQRLMDELTYVIDLGLNSLRLEGKLENPEFFEAADRLGIMVLPGWECCDKWEAHAGTGGAAWSEQDYLIARRSMANEARLLRNHPSVVVFLIGSDFAPEPRLADLYIAELEAADWTMPIVSSAASRWNNAGPDDPEDLDTTATSGAGPSGMKMWPYDWVPPVYWYSDRFGGAFGFDSECSAGHSIPRLPGLRRMLSSAEIDALWQRPEAHHFHAAPSHPFDSLEAFHSALSRRYGEITCLNDFVAKAQLANYETVRAQFEAYRGRFHADRPATGVIYWMLNAAWPSLNWQLFDYYLDPAGSYFGAKKANEPLHVQLSYDTHEILVLNGAARDAGPLKVEVVLRCCDGSVRSRTERNVGTVGARTSASAGTVEVVGDITSTYFVELMLSDDEHRCRSRNVYWMSTRDDVLDWDKSTFQLTPQAEYADLTGLAGLPSATLEVTGASSTRLGHTTTRVTLHNTSPTPAVGIHAWIAAASDGRPVAPVRWDDNDVTLFGGQRVTLTARYSGTGSPAPLVRVEALNVSEQAVPLPLGLPSRR